MVEAELIFPSIFIIKLFVLVVGVQLTVMSWLAYPSTLRYDYAYHRASS